MLSLPFISNACVRSDQAPRGIAAMKRPDLSRAVRPIDAIPRRIVRRAGPLRTWCGRDPFRRNEHVPRATCELDLALPESRYRRLDRGLWPRFGRPASPGGLGRGEARRFPHEVRDDP